MNHATDVGVTRRSEMTVRLKARAVRGASLLFIFIFFCCLGICMKNAAGRELKGNAITRKCDQDSRVNEVIPSGGAPK